MAGEATYWLQVGAWLEYNAPISLHLMLGHADLHRERGHHNDLSIELGCGGYHVDLHLKWDSGWPHFDFHQELAMELVSLTLTGSRAVGATFPPPTTSVPTLCPPFHPTTAITPTL